ncbi:hypothetical protein [Shewanella pneumatophori]|uniref:Uncharacterized protein n=1 Tax=Shewanella pneumatophori TaxID=314092 RepID=A0A9X1ZEL3_9GAMM|nr:hypothetical protein [Shewanella pneumatophori]MCL1140258.1 hypothetical protein [Shewanella pneumatophori]
MDSSFNEHTDTIDYDSLEMPAKVVSLEQLRNKNSTSIYLGRLGTANTEYGVSIPQGYEDDLVCQCMIWFLGTTYVQNHTNKTIIRYITNIQYFFDFLTHKAPTVPLPFSILNEYKHYITTVSDANNSGLTQNKKYRGALLPLEHLALSQSDENQTKSQLPENLLNWQEHVTYRVKAGRLGSNLSENSEARDCLSSLFKGCEYSDTALINSLKVVASTTLLLFAEKRGALREHLEKDKEFQCLLVEALDKHTISEPPNSCGFLRTNNGRNSQEQVDYAHGLYHRLSKAVCELNDPILLEVWSYNLGKVNPASSKVRKFTWSSTPTINEMTNLWSVVTATDGRINTNLAVCNRSKSTKVCSVSTINALTVRDLLTITDFEQLLMLWLKNADKIYDDAALAMTIDDHIISTEDVFGRSIKGRRDKMNRVVLSTPATKANLLYYATVEYTNAIESCQKLLCKDQQGKLFPGFAFSWLKFLSPKTRVVSPTYKLLTSLVDDSSHILLFLKSELGETKLKPFQWLLQNIISQKQSLNASAIRNSVIAAEAARGMRGEAFDDALDRDAEAAGHSVETRLNTYISRTKSREIASSVIDMERKAIEMMEQDANAILNAFESAKEGGFDVISQAQVEELRKKQKYKDVNSSHSKLYQAFESEEQADGMLYAQNNHYLFIESPLSVAFMLTQIHLKLAKADLNKINLNDAQNTSLLTDVVIMRYVMENKFTTQVVEEGEKFFEEHIKPTLEIN